MPLARGELRSPIFRIAIDTTMARQANVMLEYEYAEAAKLLANNLEQVGLRTVVVLVVYFKRLWRHGGRCSPGRDCKGMP